MKFFSKNINSKILAEGLVYSKTNSKNARLKDLLVEEQHSFCAYTEKYFDPLDSIDLEHFDSSIKYRDNYYNYYAVLHKPNLYKKDEKYKGVTFSKFYQDKTLLLKRIKYLKDNFIFEEMDPLDQEAIDFIEFLGLNNPDLFMARKNHFKRISEIFKLANYTSDEEKISFFENHKSELSFISILEGEMNLDLSQFYT